MNLRDIRVATEAVRVDDEQSFDVRGLSFADILSVFQKNTVQTRALFREVVGGLSESGLTADSIMAVASKAATEVPEVVAALVAHAADQPENADTVLRLPMLVQLNAIEKVIALTFTSEAELEKLVEIVTSVAGKLLGSLTMLRQPSSLMTGSSESESGSPSS